MTNHISDERRQVSVFLLTVLQSVINEQIKAKQLEPHVAAVKDQAIRKQWIEYCWLE